MKEYIISTNPNNNNRLIRCTINVKEFYIIQSLNHMLLVTKLLR